VAGEKDGGCISGSTSDHPRTPACATPMFAVGFGSCPAAVRGIPVLVLRYIEVAEANEVDHPRHDRAGRVPPHEIFAFAGTPGRAGSKSPETSLTLAQWQHIICCVI